MKIVSEQKLRIELLNMKVIMCFSRKYSIIYAKQKVLVNRTSLIDKHSSIVLSLQYPIIFCTLNGLYYLRDFTSVPINRILFLLR